jgi:hypothetical protein
LWKAEAWLMPTKANAALEAYPADYPADYPISPDSTPDS